MPLQERRRLAGGRRLKLLRSGERPKHRGGFACICRYAFQLLAFLALLAIGWLGVEVRQHLDEQAMKTERSSQSSTLNPGLLQTKTTAQQATTSSTNPKNTQLQHQPRQSQPKGEEILDEENDDHVEVDLGKYITPLKPTGGMNGSQEIFTMPSCHNQTIYGTKPVLEAFKLALEGLNKVGADYWISAGTLLGFVRNCSHIHYDIDIAIDLNWARQPFKEMILVEMIAGIGGDGRMKHHKFFKGIDGTHLSEGGEKNFIFNHKIKVDMFHSVRTKSFFRNGFSTQRALFSCPRPMTDIQNYKWGDLTVRVPMPYDDVLRATYGDDYMTPKRRLDRDEHFRWKATEGGCLVIRQGKSLRENNLGIITCLASEESVVQALALVEHLKYWSTIDHMNSWERPVQLEIYHYGRLKPELKARLGNASSSVKIIDLPKDHNDGDDSMTTCFTDAVQTTKFAHALLVRPSIVFLRNPLHLVYTSQYVHEKDDICAGKCRSKSTCVTATENDFKLVLQQRTKMLGTKQRGYCMVRTHWNSSISDLIVRNTEQVTAKIHNTVHGSTDWIHPVLPAFVSQLQSFMQETERFRYITPTGDIRLFPEDYVPHLQSYCIKYKQILDAAS